MNVTHNSDLVYDAAAVRRLLAIPTLKCPKCVDGCLTFYDPGWSIVELQRTFDVRAKGSSHWHVEEPFARLADSPRYRHLRMTAVADSFGKTFGEQSVLLLDNEEVPSARVVFMGMVIHFLATGERLFHDHCVRCRDRVMDRHLRVYLGYFDSDGFLVDGISDYDRHDYLGLASARML